jgi:general secretion pathway protein D
MKFAKSLASAAGVICLLVLPSGPAGARTRKGDKAYKLGQRAEAEKDWDAALNYYDEALATDPKDAAYMMADQRIHATAAQQHLAEGRELQRAQKLEQALAQFQKAFLADPGSQIALQEIRTTTAMLKERAKSPAGTPIYTPAERARMEVEKRVSSLEGPPVLRPLTNQISSLKMNAQPARVLYESVCRYAGVNALFDPTGLETGGAGKNYNLDLTNVTLEEALNYVALVTHTFWKPISSNAIFVTQEGEQKRLEYQDEVVKVFYVQNASTQNEFVEIFNAVRIGSKIQQGVFQVQSQNAIVARGTPDSLALVEKLVHDLDKPKAEVVMDIIVMEVNKTTSSTIGAAILGQGGLNVPLNYTPRFPVTSTTSGTGTTTTGTTGTPTTTTPSTTLANLGRFSSADYSTTLPSTVVQALLSDSRSHVLQRPQLRATDGGSASLKIGLKVPYVSGSLNSAVATPGSIPYATTQFQQVETGTLIDLKPHVNGTEDISMHIKVELSNVVQNILIAGIEEPEIGQQIDEADIRMKDGEVSILGGLSDREKSNALSGVPGFSNIPLLGYIFGTRKKDSTDNEVLIAVIPHIIRAPDYGDPASRGVYAGTDRVPRVEYRKANAPNWQSNGSNTPGAPMPAPKPVPYVPPVPSAPNQGGPASVPMSAAPAPQSGPPIIVHPPDESSAPNPQ